jgi:hypothetical protein
MSTGGVTIQAHRLITAAAAAARPGMSILTVECAMVEAATAVGAEIERRLAYRTASKHDAFPES